eukprot:TRINITY_DN71103_c5_g1_i1.p3 TRINITY_DN71103_c5_g1~~TRINITY_DN71103_c5_g1_i1.p3  ORF type:complete len:627 (+),score=67.27 TRINITY_DN71103_c5_g1_i1:11580-13460(+)
MHGSSQKEKRIENSVKAALRIHMTEGPGDILVFLTGFEECEQAVQLCYHKLEKLKNLGKPVPSMMIVPLYGAMQSEEQSLAFEKPPPNCRKIVFATNIAETSLTVNGVAFVIDSGYVKQKQYNPKTGMDTLVITPISKVQAVQRTGRAGRTGPGKCYRLYTEQFYNTQMADVTTPEIQRVNLAGTLLTLKNMGIEDVVEFDFIDPPDKDSIIHALKQLYFIRAIDKQGKLTTLGKELCKLPLEPSYAKSLIASLFFQCEEETLKMVSILSAESIWQNVSVNDQKRRREYEETRKAFMDPKSDHLSLINVYEKWEAKHKSESWCRKNFLRIRSLRQANNIYQQLKDYMNKIDMEECKKYIVFSKAVEDAMTKKKMKLHTKLGRTIAYGFFMNACRRVPGAGDSTSYLTVNEGHMAQIDFNSCLAAYENYPDWILYTEISGTSKAKSIIRMACEIKLKWIEEMLPLLKSVDVLLLAKLKVDTSQDGKKRMAPEDKEEEREEDIKKKEADKLQAAKERYLKRKKVEQQYKRLFQLRDYQQQYCYNVVWFNYYIRSRTKSPFLPHVIFTRRLYRTLKFSLSPQFFNVMIRAPFFSSFPFSHNALINTSGKQIEAAYTKSASDQSTSVISP